MEEYPVILDIQVIQGVALEKLPVLLNCERLNDLFSGLKFQLAR